VLTLCSIHKLVLDTIGVQSIAAVIGGSMGGMHTLEWPLSTPSGFVKNIVPIATSAYQGAWGISWGETQRQAICTDSTFNEGWYEPVPRSQPRAGLGVARMIGMLTYRSFDSFEARFGRRVGLPMKRTVNIDVLPTPPLSDAGSTTEDLEDTFLSPRYSAQSYLQYQADKFLDRFDANCYLHLLKKMNTHDVTRGRHYSDGLNQIPTVESLKSSLSTLPEGTTVIGVQTDLLFPLQQQIQLAQCLPDARYVALQSTDGHDGFLLDFDTLNGVITEHLRKRCSWVYEGDARTSDILQEAIVVDSVFGELENAEC
jgi:homoserine O-acetyltransferase